MWNSFEDPYDFATGKTVYQNICFTTWTRLSYYYDPNTTKKYLIVIVLKCVSLFNTCAQDRYFVLVTLVYVAFCGHIGIFY